MSASLIDFPRPDRAGLHIWKWTNLDPRALGPGAFDPDDLDEVASNVHARLCGYQYASRVRGMQFWMMGLSLVVAFLSALGGFVIAETTWLRTSVFIGGFMGIYVILVPFLTKLACLGIKPDPRGVIERCFFRKIDEDAPDDLASISRIGFLTSEGDPIASEIRPEDATSVEAVRRARAWWSPTFCMAGAFSCFVLHHWMLFEGLWVLTIGALIVWKVWRDRDPLVMRAKMR